MRCGCGRDPPSRSGEARPDSKSALGSLPRRLPSVPPDIRVWKRPRRCVGGIPWRNSTALAVVVGRRGHGGYTGMRLGSVAHGLLHRAECPVITVPGEA
ncbi:universal stress protein [Streptomyces sp. NPDC004980]